ncbi:histidine kinase [filamentous cyanobacterium CCP5]|nr:histidine kinase [filamentous cyanobacterium CCP5]
MPLKVYRYLPAGLVLGLGLGLTFAATVWVGRWERLTRQSEFQTQTDNLTTSLQRTINRYNDLILSLSDFYRATDNQVDGVAFSQFVRRALGSYPGIQALEWAPQVSAIARSDYERWLRSTTRGGRDTITERTSAGTLIPAGVRPSYVPVTFLEPWQDNELALGYDLASDLTRRIALERARDTGAIAATGRIKLVQETTEDQYSFLVFAPVYNRPATTLVGRRQQLEGYVLGVFRVADVVEESLQDLIYDVDFYIYDQTAPTSEQFLGFYDAQTQRVTTETEPIAPSHPNPLCQREQECDRRISLGQREWRLVFTPTTQTPLWGTLATLLIGLLVTISLLIYLSRWQSEIRRTRELSNLKLRLFSMASHELRTPLSVIWVSAQSWAANQTQLTPAQQYSTIERIQLAAKRMGQLVNDMLTLSRAEAGKLEFAPEIVELEGFCRQIFDQVDRQPNQTLDLHLEPALTKAYLDKNLLHSILVNLLSNAVKYSPEDAPVQLVVAGDDQSLRFRVIDQGIGIPAEAQNQIFEAFYRGENVGSVPGTGLGLAVVKTCVELHGGLLKVESSAKGTCITVILPWVE